MPLLSTTVRFRDFRKVTGNSVIAMSTHHENSIKLHKLNTVENRVYIIQAASLCLYRSHAVCMCQFKGNNKIRELHWCRMSLSKCLI
jgi:hypothetical protein